MKHYAVDITDEALADMEQIYNHIAVKLQAPENALRQYNRIAERVLLLDSMAERYHIMDSEPERSRGMRLMPVDNYFVFYTIEEDRVIVTNILYSALDLRARLGE